MKPHSAPMITCNNLHFSYGTNHVLRGVSFEVARGECMAVLGRNGEGKSTLVKNLIKLLTPHTGEITLNGTPTTALNRQDMAKLAAYVAQHSEATQMTAFDYVLLGRKPHIQWAVGESDLQMCADMLELVGMADKQLHDISTLSGGERQKVILARALVQEPSILILDEPTSNLDPRNQYEMLGLVRQLAVERDIAVIAVLHDLNVALRHCDQLLFLHDGTSYANISRDEVTADIISHVYEVTADIIEHNGHKLVAIDV